MEATADRLWDFVRGNIIGWNAHIETPFGARRLTYADYTASGRGVTFIEDALREALELYGNTHTEDDTTGIVTTARLHAAESTIKRLVNAGPHHKLIMAGAGATAAVHLLQQILGVYIPPAAKEIFTELGRALIPAGQLEAFSSSLRDARPVVMVGPYEHHSNEISWRECFAEVVEVELTATGLLDLDDLQRKASRPRYRGRRKIGAFSAASNVTGVKTPVYEVARILHANDALALFDFAAAAPYQRMDVNHDAESFFDAMYFSPHKLLGGPGAGGALVIHERIYRADLPPTVGAGGTVDFVNFDGQEYNPDIEVRETPGTPGILQTLRAALAMELKELMGVERIEQREKDLGEKAYRVFRGVPSLEVLGEVEPEHRLPIFSFNVRVGPSYLHPRFVTTLLNDLFGIQSRAGCSCAAPYGHRMLHIDPEKSRHFRRTIMCGNVGLKPGWARVNFHYLHTDEEVDFICRAIEFVAERGRDFLPLYSFDIHTGAWRHRHHKAPEAAIGLEKILEGFPRPGKLSAAPGPEPASLSAIFNGYLEEAEELARSLRARNIGLELKTTETDLIPFVYT